MISDAAVGYATPTIGFETVDECGLRYLMAMKQHEYLLLCLPLQQKHTLRSRYIIYMLYIMLILGALNVTLAAFYSVFVSLSESFQRAFTVTDHLGVAF